MLLLLLLWGDYIDLPSTTLVFFSPIFFFGVGSSFFADHLSSDSQFFGGMGLLLPFCLLSFTIFFNAADLRAKAVLVSFSVLYEEIFCQFVHLRRHYRSSQPFFGATEGATAIYSRGWARDGKNIFFPPPPPPRAFLISPRDLTNARRTSIPHFFSSRTDCPFITAFFRLFFFGWEGSGWVDAIFGLTVFWGGWLRCHAQLLRATQKKRTLLLEMIRVMMPSREKKTIPPRYLRT